MSWWWTDSLHPAGQLVCNALPQTIDLEPTTTAEAQQLSVALAPPFEDMPKLIHSENVVKRDARDRASASGF